MNVPDLRLYEQQRSADHLRVLSICHYVYAVLGLLGVLMIVAYIAILEVAFQPGSAMNAGHGATPEELAMMRAFFRAVMAMAMLMSILHVVANFLTARWLQARRNRSLCIVVSAWNCLGVPLGTVLGVFTILVLNRNDVRESFA